MTLVCSENNKKANKDLSKSLVSSDSVFKKPVNPAPKKKRILDEDTYSQDLEEIIERDFFPDLAKLKAQVEYQTAVDCNDIEKLRDLRLKYGTRLSTRLATEDSVKSPATFETPVVDRSSPAKSSSTASNFDLDDGEPKDLLPKTKLQTGNTNSRIQKQNLDSYLSKNTSEDNASFSTIMEEADEKHRAKYRWLYEKETEHERYQQTALELPDQERKQSLAIDKRYPDTWTYTNKNYLMYIPEGAALTEEEKQDILLKQREISHTNTRFQKIPFNEIINRQAISAAAQVQARNREGKIGVDGKEFVVGEEPTVNGYNFLMTPSPAPGVSETPLMTWGEIDGSPFRLDGGDTPAVHTPGPSFRIPAVPARDKLGIELAEQVGKNYRNRKQLALKTVRETLYSPSPKGSHVERLTQMSPAAQRLASSRFGIHLGSDKSLRRSYTPSPARSRTATDHSVSGSSPRTPSSIISSPCIIKKTPKRSSQSTPTQSITDNLLQLPKRPKAADFFTNL